MQGFPNRIDSTSWEVDSSSWDSQFQCFSGVYDCIIMFNLACERYSYLPPLPQSYFSEIIIEPALALILAGLIYSLLVNFIILNVPSLC